MNLYKCYLIANDCYKAQRYLNPPSKIVVHSTGVNNTQLRRYVQPLSNQTIGITQSPTYIKNLIGINSNGNSWNRSGVSACVNAFIGTTADGSIATIQTLPWNMRAWGVGSGSKGSYNNYAIQFECCEDNLLNSTYCKKIFEEAAQLCAYLITLYPNIKVSDIVNHNEAHALGYASGHNDTDNWWPKHGLNMNKFRARVQEILDKQAEEKEDENMTDEKFAQLYQHYQENFKDNDSSSWSKEARDWAIKQGIISGIGNLEDGTPNYAWEAPLTREQLVTLLYNYNKKIIPVRREKEIKPNEYQQTDGV